MEKLNKLEIKYSLSVVPVTKRNIILKMISISLIRFLPLESTNGNVELTLHGLYHQVDGQMDDFDIRRLVTRDKNVLFYLVTWSNGRLKLTVAPFPSILFSAHILPPLVSNYFF